MACPIPPLAPRSVAAWRKDARLGYYLREQGPIKVLNAVRWVRRGGSGLLFTKETHMWL